MKRVKILANGLSTFHVKDRRDLSRGNRGTNFRCRVANGECAGAFHPQEVPDHRSRNRLRDIGTYQVVQRDIIGRGIHQRLGIGRVMRFRRRDVDSEKPADKATLTHPGKVQMALAIAFQPDLLAVLRRAQQPQKKIVMAVEDLYHVAAASLPMPITFAARSFALLRVRRKPAEHRIANCGQPQGVSRVTGVMPTVGSDKRRTEGGRMKLVRYGSKGREKPGILDADGGVRDLSAHVDDISGATLLPENLARISALDPESLPLVSGAPQRDLRLGACVGGIGKFICIGLNYADHAAETGMAIPPEPVIFNKWTSAVCGPNDDILIPRGAEKTDWEVELAIVIGQGGVYIDEAEATRHIAGYCIVNDVSERAYQIERGGTWDKGKGCDTFGPIGPWLVTPDEVGDLDRLGLWLDVDGKRYQNGSTATMIFAVPFLVSYVSRFMSLQPGDVISTGTPPGVGMGQKPPVYLKGGETIRLGIDGLGVQTQRVVRAEG